MTPLYKQAIEDCLPEHRELMVVVWSPTPWMINVETDGREMEIRHWCNLHFGTESSPIHGKEGNWHGGSVTMKGLTWFGFKTEGMMDVFNSQFKSDRRAG